MSPIPAASPLRIAMAPARRTPAVSPVPAGPLRSKNLARKDDWIADFPMISSQGGRDHWLKRKQYNEKEYSFFIPAILSIFRLGANRLQDPFIRSK
jgi:hypothetical protein